MEPSVTQDGKTVFTNIRMSAVARHQALGAIGHLELLGLMIVALWSEGLKEKSRTRLPLNTEPTTPLTPENPESKMLLEY
jgi:hypothetical protein